MNNFYYLHFKEDDGGAVARTCEDRDYEDERERGNVIVPFQFQLTEGLPQDYQANDLGWPLMSRALQSVFAQAGILDGVCWDEAALKVGKQTIAYYVPRFLVRPDVLDERSSRIVRGPIGDIVIKACLSRRKVKDLNFFPVPGTDVRVIVSSPFKERIEYMGLTGVDFSSVPVS